MPEATLSNVQCLCDGIHFDFSFEAPCVCCATCCAEECEDAPDDLTFEMTSTTGNNLTGTLSRISSCSWTGGGTSTQGDVIVITLTLGGTLGDPGSCGVEFSCNGSDCPTGPIPNGFTINSCDPLDIFFNIGGLLCSSCGWSSGDSAEVTITE